MTDVYKNAMNLAIDLASEFEGNTSPNPPVGCVLLDANNQIISYGAHERSGTPHAEIHALQKAESLGKLHLIHTLVVTLEPCSHTQKKTPPCAQKIAALPIPTIVIGCLDPNPLVHGQGMELLKKSGKNIIVGIEENKCLLLIKGFRSMMEKKRPWIILKRAFNEEGSMIPEFGKKTFTTQKSLLLSHTLRKKSDAILTGIGTILSDAPLFTIRHLNDFPDKKRFLAICEGTRKTPDSYIRKAKKNGFILIQEQSIEALLQKLSELNVLQILVEAGPRLSQSILEKQLWDEKFEIYKNKLTPDTDTVVHSFKD